MKYLLVLLLLVVAPYTRSSGPASLVTRLDLDASFDVATDGDAYHVYVTVARWPDRARVALNIEEAERACSPDGSCGLRVRAEGRAPVAPGDVVIAPTLQWASIHAVVPLTDDVTHQSVAVRVDLTILARGDFHRGDGSGNPGYFNATATGVVASRDTTFVRQGQTATRGTIARTALS